MAATSRLEIRLRSEIKARLEYAAELEHMPVSEFVRTAAVERAERVVMDHQSQTRVPAEYFDQLIEALDSEPTPNPALVKAAQRARHVVKR